MHNQKIKKTGINIKKNILNFYRFSNKMEVNMIIRENKISLSFSIYPIKDEYRNKQIKIEKNSSLYDYTNGLRIDFNIGELQKILQFIQQNKQSIEFIHKTDKIKRILFNNQVNKNNERTILISIQEIENSTIENVLNNSKIKSQKFVLNDDEIILIENVIRFALQKYFQLKIK